MRILCICSSWRVFGAETITLKLLEGFQRNGHSVHAVTSLFTDGEFSRRLAAIGVPETIVPIGGLSKKLAWRPMLWNADGLMRLPVLWFKYAQLLHKFQPETILYTGNKQALWLRPWLGALPSFMIEYTHIEPSDANQWLYRMLARRLSSFVAVSDSMSKNVERLGAPPSKIRIVRSGAFFEEDYRTTKPLATGPFPRVGRPARLGIVGQVAPSKGHDCFLEAVKLLRSQGNQLIVQAFGSGGREYMGRLKERVLEAGLGSVWNWMGYERDKGRIFGSMDICIVPSCFDDPFPTVAMEAGAFALPVVASRAGGLPEIVEDAVTGWLVEPNQPAQLASKIEWLVRNPDKAQEMGVAGRQRVFKHFTVEKMVAEFEQLFSEHVRPIPTVTR